MTVCHSLTSLYTSNEHAQHFSDCKPVSKKFIEVVVASSQVCRPLALCIGQVSNHPSVGELHWQRGPLEIFLHFLN